MDMQISVLDKKRTIEEITKEESEGKILLGTAAGIDCYHCLYLGVINSRGLFLKKVNFYRICEGDERIKPDEYPVTVAFYK
ncbi:MAG: hypothetical protein KKA65_05205 [Nanoarchaeota archaeon]|nr:hypothetical protein [Nanoarchaeota archaeon]MBU4242336.1 hypothetical protein [Nanoarchaeota archaeon]MBU4352581.1 hypothetical protein [Nanoarchaeota archaeon]MBU4456870.1 hypothetical protein [Nanoarchaeota archaeon]MCG2719564.1 hypothetical protein [Nanoarchaeota archaeon]